MDTQEETMTISKVWHQYGDFERFHIEESPYHLFTSVTESGTKMLTALTYDICLEMTEFHQICNAPDYDGRYDVSKFDGTVGGKL